MAADYTPQELERLQQDAMQRVREMQQRAQRVVSNINRSGAEYRPTVQERPPGPGNNEQKSIAGEMEQASSSATQNQSQSELSNTRRMPPAQFPPSSIKKMPLDYLSDASRMPPLTGGRERAHSNQEQLSQPSGANQGGSRQQGRQGKNEYAEPRTRKMPLDYLNDSSKPPLTGGRERVSSNQEQMSQPPGANQGGSRQQSRQGKNEYAEPRARKMPLDYLQDSRTGQRLSSRESRTHEQNQGSDKEQTDPEVRPGAPGRPYNWRNSYPDSRARKMPLDYMAPSRTSQRPVAEGNIPEKETKRPPSSEGARETAPSKPQHSPQTRKQPGKGIFSNILPGKADKGIFSDIKSLLSGFLGDSDRLLIMGLILLLSSEEQDELLMLALLYIML